MCALTSLEAEKARVKKKLGSGRSLVLLAVVMLAGLTMGQSGHRPVTSNSGGVSVNVVAKRDNDRSTPVTSKEVAVYDNGVEQAIKNFTPDPSPARIVLLVDNSLSIRADVEKLEQAAREFAYEIYEGDKLLIVGYDEEAEIIADWTDDAKSINTSLKLFRKKGQPHLFDAIRAVVDQAMRPLQGQKRIIVVISDGLDRGSKATFEQIVISYLMRRRVRHSAKPAACSYSATRGLPCEPRLSSNRISFPTFFSMSSGTQFLILCSTTEQEAVATWPFRDTQALVEWHRNGQVATASCSVVERQR